MREYETTVVIDSLLKNEEIEETIEKIERYIKNNGGTIKSVGRWGKKRLAYEIKKRQYGYYVCIQFEAPGSLIKLLEREYGLNERILRYLTLAIHKTVTAKKAYPSKEAKPESKSEDILEDEVLLPSEVESETSENENVGDEVVEEKEQTPPMET